MGLYLHIQKGFLILYCFKYIILNIRNASFYESCPVLQYVLLLPLAPTYKLLQQDLGALIYGYIFEVRFS